MTAYYEAQVIEGGDPNSRRSEPSTEARSEYAATYVCVVGGCDELAVQGGLCGVCERRRW